MFPDPEASLSVVRLHVATKVSTDHVALPSLPEKRSSARFGAQMEAHIMFSMLLSHVS